MSQRALGAQFKKLGITTRDFTPQESEGGRRKPNFELTTDSEQAPDDPRGYLAGGKRDGGVWPWLDSAMSNEWRRLKPLSPDN